jgi:hypothetical protein
LWDFDSITEKMPPLMPVVIAAYEYHRSRPKALYLAGHPERLAVAAKLSQDFPEWPSVPWIFTNPVHSFDFAYRGWPSSPLVIDGNLPKKEVLRVCAEQWEARRGGLHIPRGSGAPDRQACARLRWLGHKRLFSGIRHISSGWKANDENRFTQLYQPFLRSEGLFSFESLQQLQKAIRKANWLLQNVLALPLSN